ncbi:cytochrome c class I [Catalinimonas niigatensis]|uniref:cytochrome c class I n=1 Tax=Catalinimonas niigatensis TaxID=1397264 RepID=UPI002665CB73|nr:cytochrome c class I [Catalinimonas niigatensis]WPP48628.1 cytochrome c class I [Catalinimonas niigatensis]
MSLFVFATACDQNEMSTAVSEKPTDKILPKALVSDISIAPFMEIERGGIRLGLDPVSGDFFYNTMRGDIFRIYRNQDSLYDEKIYTVEDHGIESLQGMHFQDSSIFLVGNKFYNDNRATKGIVIRGKLDAEHTYVWDTLAITELYGKPKTLYSHEFNGIAMGPDKNYIYVNSGARTDHGEVQDNDGLYPGLRESNLTACVFKLPADGKDIVLKDDMDYLKKNGYLFADGVRNAYDLDFSPSGHLFAVSNSSDYDHPEDMFWLREGHHYGFPWRMGDTDNPQQYPDWDPDPEKDPFINPAAYAYANKYFKNDPDFPKKPKELTITAPVMNYGPDANFYRDVESGEVLDGDESGKPVGTFTSHRSPLGLFFDQDSTLSSPFKGDGFVLSYSFGENSPLMRPISSLGGDLIHMKLEYKPEMDNYIVHCYRIVDGFRNPTDALIIANTVYVIETGGMIWKITLPTDINL